MTVAGNALSQSLVRSLIGDKADLAIATLNLDEVLENSSENRVSRAAFAAVLNIILFEQLLERVPSAAAYVADRRAAGERIRFDHGALRTIRFAGAPTGALPPGEEAFTRIFRPLGYELAGIYPLPALRMTGRAYAHADAPSVIPQFFLSELHVERFDEDFGAAATSVFGASRDPLGRSARDALDQLAATGWLPFALAEAALPELVGAFGRQHPVPALADYETLLAQSAEAAWIATEGNAFNHATDRVADVEAVAAEQRRLGRPMKDQVEVSTSGRVRQTAFRADMVRRHFRDPAGDLIEREAPGSFYEFITRDLNPATGELDLGFDSGNATGIFAMTRSS